MAKDRRKLQHIHSSIKDRQPTPATLEVGEIAVNNNADNEFLSLKNSEDKVVRFSSDAQVIEWMERKEVMPYVGYVRGGAGPGATAEGSTADTYGSYGIQNSDLINNTSEIIIKLNQVAADKTTKHNKVNGAKDRYNKEVNPTDDYGVNDGAGFFIDMSRYAMQDANPRFSGITNTCYTTLNGTTKIQGLTGDCGSLLDIKIDTANSDIETATTEITVANTTIGTNDTTISGNTTLKVSGTTTETKKGDVTETNLADKQESTSGNSYNDVKLNYSGTTGGTTTKVKVGNVTENHSGTTTETKKGDVTENNLANKVENTSSNYTVNTTGITSMNSTGNTCITSQADADFYGKDNTKVGVACDGSITTKVTAQGKDVVIDATTNNVGITAKNDVDVSAENDININANNDICETAGVNASFYAVSRTNLGINCDNSSSSTTTNLYGDTINEVANTMNVTATTLNEEIGTETKHTSGTTTITRDNTVTETNKSNVTINTSGATTETRKGNAIENNLDNYTVNTTNNVVVNTSGSTTETKIGNVIENNRGNKTENTSGTVTVNTTGTTTINNIGKTTVNVTNGTEINSCNSFALNTNSFAVKQCTGEEGSAEFEFCGGYSVKSDVVNIEQCSDNGSITIKEKTTTISGTTLTINEGDDITMNAGGDLAINTTGNTDIITTGTTTIESKGAGSDMCISAADVAGFVGANKTNIGKNCADGGQTTTLNINGDTINETGDTINISGSSDVNIKGGTQVCISAGTKANLYAPETNVGASCEGSTATTVNVTGTTINEGGTNINETFTNGTLNITNYDLNGDKICISGTTNANVYGATTNIGADCDGTTTATTVNITGTTINEGGTTNNNTFTTVNNTATTINNNVTNYNTTANTESHTTTSFTVTTGDLCLTSTGDADFGGDTNTRIGTNCEGTGISNNTTIYASTAVTINAPVTNITGDTNISGDTVIGGDTNISGDTTIDKKLYLKTGLNKGLIWKYGSVCNASDGSTVFADNSTDASRTITVPKTISDVTCGDVSNEASCLTIGKDVCVTGKVTASGGFFQTSDRNAKENIEKPHHTKTTGARNVPIWKFNYKDDETHRDIYGIIAQEAEANGLNELVYTDENGKKSVDYTSLMILKIAYLENENARLRQELSNLSERVSKLEK